MVNSPPTPLPEPPQRKDEWRFKEITTPCEWVEAYHPGSYHPIHLGDLFKKGQYKIIRKLGYGSFSTVWLASDLKFHRYVALKVLIASISKSSNELTILRHVAQAAAPTGAKHIVKLLDDFEHEGPNGVHICLVFEHMGPSVNSMLEELPWFKPYRYGVKPRYPLWMGKRILKQSLQGLEFLHQNGVAHGDFQPGNILFTLKDLTDMSDDQLQQNDTYQYGAISPPVERVDGKVDIWAPRYLAVPQSLADHADISRDFSIRLSDLGGAYFFHQPPKVPVTPHGLRAPELILNGRLDMTQDVWSFGCLMFELITGSPLFCVPTSLSPEEDDDDHLLQFSNILGPLPDHLYALWTRSLKYFTPERVQFNSFIEEVPEDDTDPLEAKKKPLEEMFDEEKPADFPDEEAKAVKALLRRILQYDPGKRLTPSQILRDPWFADS